MHLIKKPKLFLLLVGGLLAIALFALISSCASPAVNPGTTQAVATATVQATATTTGTEAATGTTIATTTTAATTTVATTATAVTTETTAATATTTVTPTTGVTATDVATGTGSSVLTAQEKHKDIPVGFTKEGYPYRGNPDAPITMYEYSDYQCPFCERYFIQTEPAVDESYVRSGKLRVVFRDFPLVQLHPNAPAAANAALCVADQGAAKFWTMHDLLFQTQNEWASLPDPKANFVKLAEKAGADCENSNENFRDSST